jgi:6-phosphofructokinase
MNDSDHSTDYFCTDETIVYPEHPLYRYVKDAARLAEIHQLLMQAKRYRRFSEKTYMTLSDKKSYLRDAEELEAKATTLKHVAGSGTPAASDFLAAIQYTKRAG